MPTLPAILGSNVSHAGRSVGLDRTGRLAMMKDAVQSGVPFNAALKSAAGFSLAAVAIVGLLFAIAGSEPAEGLQYLSAIAGAAVGVIVALVTRK